MRRALSFAISKDRCTALVYSFFLLHLETPIIFFGMNRLVYGCSSCLVTLRREYSHSATCRAEYRANVNYGACYTSVRYSAICCNRSKIGLTLHTIKEKVTMKCIVSLQPAVNVNTLSARASQRMAFLILHQFKRYLSPVASKPRCGLIWIPIMLRHACMDIVRSP